jgi:putative phage-type endonuclease
MSTRDACDRLLQKWLADRLTGIGASETAAILGVDPYRSAFQVWAEKTGATEPDDLSANEAVEFGVRLEPVVCQAFADRTVRRVDPWPQYTSVVHPTIPWMRATPDAVQETERGVGLVQIKTTSAWNASDWDGGPPLHYQVQIQHELCVVGMTWGSLVVLIGGQKLRYYDVERDQRFIDAMVAKLRQFWSCVETKTPPEIDGSIATAKILDRLHPDDNGETVVLPDESLAWAEKLAAAKARVKAAEAEEQDAQNHLRAAIGDATYGVLPDGRQYSLKTQERAECVVRATRFRVLQLLAGGKRK